MSDDAPHVVPVNDLIEHDTSGGSCPDTHAAE